MTRTIFPTIIVIAAALLAGCATVEEETFSTIVVDDETYELRTRTIDGPNGTYETTSAMVGGIPSLCIPDSPGDCAAAVRRARDAIEDFR